MCGVQSAPCTLDDKIWKTKSTPGSRSSASEPPSPAPARREDLNGQAGVATDFDHAKGRYVVAWGGKGEKSQVMKIKQTNLRLKS